jgi:hypothetical protein
MMMIDDHHDDAVSRNDGDIMFLETLASTYEFTRHQNQKRRHRHPHSRENLKFYIMSYFIL